MMNITKNLIVATFILQAGCATKEATIDKVELGRNLSDCGALFGLLAKANSSHADGMRQFAMASTMYSLTAFNNDKAFEEQTKLSVKKASEFIKSIQKSSDKSKFENEFNTCITTLKTAEKNLREDMTEINKSIVPVIFNNSKT